MESDSQLGLRLYDSGHLFSDTLFPWLRAPCLDPLESDSQLVLRLYGSGHSFSDTLFPLLRAPCLDPRQDKKYSATIIRARTPTCCWRWPPITVQLNAAMRLQFPTRGHITSHKSWSGAPFLLHLHDAHSPVRYYRVSDDTNYKHCWVQVTAGAEQTKA